MSAQRKPLDDDLSEALAWCASLPMDLEKQAVLRMRRVFDKWSLFALGVLGKNGPMRFSALARALPDVSQKVLTRTLRDLEADELISRHVYSETVLRVEYALTLSGSELLGMAAPLFAWHVRRLVNATVPSTQPEGPEPSEAGLEPDERTDLSSTYRGPRSGGRHIS
jgi:DNA-binding HxlR family transcriptional regulator